MLIFAVDTSTRSGSVAVLRDGQVLAVVDDSEQVPYAARLFSDVALLQQRAKFSLAEVDLFAVAAGPGSFTGLRVGLSAVKAWAEVYGKPVAAISGLEAVAEQAQADAPTVAAGVDARRGAVFGAIYRRDTSSALGLKPIYAEAILSVEEFCAAIDEHRGQGPMVIASPTAGLFTPDSRRWDGTVRIEAVSPILAPAIGLLAFERFTRGEVVTALELDANYVRRSDAEVNKRS